METQFFSTNGWILFSAMTLAIFWLRFIATARMLRKRMKGLVKLPGDHVLPSWILSTFLTESLLSASKLLRLHSIWSLDDSVINTYVILFIFIFSSVLQRFHENWSHLGFCSLYRHRKGNAPIHRTTASKIVPFLTLTIMWVEILYRKKSVYSICLSSCWTWFVEKCSLLISTVLSLIIMINC